MSAPSSRRALWQSALCALALAGLLGSAVRFGLYDVALSEQMIRIAVGALR